MGYSNQIDVYMKDFDEKAQTRMKMLREKIHEMVPEVEEAFSWSMPTFKYKGHNLCHFAKAKNHLGFYPGSDPIARLKEELGSYATSKGTITFKDGEDLPWPLIEKVIKACVDREEKR